MANLTFYFAPITCARVTLIALEEIGAPYNLRLVNIMGGEQLTPDYLAIYPDAKLLPLGNGIFEDAVVQSDLNFMSSGMHPLITRLCRSQFFCTVPGGPESVHAIAADLLRFNLPSIDERLSKAQYWYGESWSIMDAYLDWLWFRITSTRFDVSPYVHFARHYAAGNERPSARRAEQHGAAAVASLVVAA